MNAIGQKRINQSGSPKKSEPEFLVTGKLRKSHGLKGEMWVEVITEHPELLDKGKDVFIGEKHLKAIIKSFKIADKSGLIRFEGYENPESLTSFNNSLIYSEMKNIPDLAEGEYYRHSIIGLNVKDNNGAAIGKITDILVTGANDVYVITSDDSENDILIPAIKAVIQKIDIESNLMIVNPPEWD